MLSVIPHAGPSFAGQARASAFQIINEMVSPEQVTDIYYLATIHRPLQLSPNRIYFNESQPVTKVALAKEHSYRWVEPELRTYFPQARHHVFYIHPSSPTELLDSFCYTLAKLTSTSNSSNKSQSLILCSADLIHYGAEYSLTGFPFPQQLMKARLEAPLIEALRTQDIHRVDSILDSKPYLTCGPGPLRCAVRLAKFLQLDNGRVTDYYDSWQASHSLHNTIQRYEISLEPVTTMVSYVSLLWPLPKATLKASPETLLPFDKLQALAAVQSTIALQVLDFRSSNKWWNWQDLLPVWSAWAQMKQGVFVGTEIQDGLINCSYGDYGYDEYNSHKSLAQGIIQAASHCLSDARDRWQRPFSLDHLASRVKVELLQPEEDWLHVAPASRLADVLKLDGKMGVLLRHPKYGQATFLPSVGLEFDSIDEYLGALMKKMGGPSSQWRDPQAEAWIYTSAPFFAYR